MPSLFSKNWKKGLRRNEYFPNLISFKRPGKKGPMGLKKAYKTRGLAAWNPTKIGKMPKAFKTRAKKGNKNLHWSQKYAKRTKAQQLMYRDRAKAKWFKESGWKWGFGRRPR